jgi:uncharacterized protein (DUF2236 family)
MDETDTGLFGPDSVTWQLHSDPMMWIAGIRALYLQALHPPTLRGVLQNSDFRKDTWGRLLRTVHYVATISYGPTPTAEKAGARLRRLHSRLKVTHPVTGERHGVDEPELLLWVHCAEIDSYLTVMRRSGLRVDDARADRYVDEQRRSARLVGLDPAEVPATAAGLAAYFTRMLPELACGPDAREVDAFLRRLPAPPVLRQVWPLVASLAYDSLPHFAHELYGRPAPAPAAVDRRLTITGNLLRLIPRRVSRYLPPRDIRRAVVGLGPQARPDPYAMGRTAPILDGPGGDQRSDGGDSGPWPTPG